MNDDAGNSVKIYIVLYTCLGLRCIHLDLVPDFTLNSFLQSFRRFCNTYRVSKSIYTDNAQYFIASRNYLEKALLEDEFQAHLRENGITHKTIPAYANWMGGVYERQIKTVKQCLYKTLGKAKIKYFDLLTVLSDILNSINNRPLTYVYSDVNEIEPLTPNKILKLHTNPRLELLHNYREVDPLWEPSSKDNLHAGLNKTLNAQQQLYEAFRRQWYSQYLLSLRESSRDVFQTNWNDRIAVNSIVQVSSANKPMIFWQLGRVVKLIHGDDGKVRSAILKMPNKKTAHYSVKHLFTLEIQSTHLGEHQDSSTTLPQTILGDDEHVPVTNKETQPSTSALKRPQRKAAVVQREQLQENIKRGLLQTDF